jgi:hypothetical protein
VAVRDGVRLPSDVMSSVREAADVGSAVGVVLLVNVRSRRTQ